MMMPWGKYEGHEIDTLPSWYLKWLAEECDNDDIATEADEEWQYREKTDTHLHGQEPNERW